MSSTQQLRLLVCGSVDGKIDKLFKKVNSVQSKSGKFDALLCSGSFFGADGSVDASWEDYLSGKLQVPIETYILGPTTPAQVSKYAKAKRGGDLCENVSYLGQQGVLVMPNGLKVSYLSGVFDRATHMEEDQPEPRIGYSKADVDCLVNFANRSSFSGVDVFLTARWPTGVSYGAPVAATGMPGANSECPGSGAAAAALRPRYHFGSSSSDYYERAPYSNTTAGKPPVNVTRFHGMGHVANPTKQKWIYAFNVTPMSKLAAGDLIEVPNGTTPSPYHRAPSNARPKEEEGFFFTAQKGRANNRGPRHNNNNNNGGGVCFDFQKGQCSRGDDCRYSHAEGGGSGQQDSNHAPPQLPPGILPPSAANGGLLPPPLMGDDNRKRKREFVKKPTGPCWFCLGGPDVEKHLVTAIGNKVYVALAKGGLVPKHSLICPIQHIASSADLEQEVADEMAALLQQHADLFAKEDKVVVAFERNLRSQHLQVQVCPVPKDRANNIEAAFREAGLALSPNFVWETIAVGDPLPEGTTDATKYFLVTLPDGRRLFHKCQPGFSLQFGREVLASAKLLDMRDRVDWQKCKVDKEVETTQARVMRDLFKEQKKAK